MEIPTVGAGKIVAKIGKDSGLSKEQELLDTKRKITELVRVKFARFGDDALSIVLAYALQPVRMPQLLERLELRVSAQDLPTRLDAVCQWIFDNGPIQFKSRALAERQTSGKDQFESVLPDFRPAVVPTEASGAAPSATPPVESTPIKKSPVESSAPAPAPASAKSLPSKPTPAAPKKSNETAAPSATSSGRQINTPGYSGADRRVGGERRHKADRRGRLDATDRNKRFGGDRRKSAKGRRKEDQPKPDFWWKSIPSSGDPKRPR